MKDSPVEAKIERPKPSISLSTLDDKKIKDYTVEDVVAVSGKGRITRISEMYDHKGEFEVSIELSDVICVPTTKKAETKKPKMDKAYFEKIKAEEK